MDGLRAVAVAGVFLLHLSNVTGMTIDNHFQPGPLLNWVSYCWTAVPVFFAISGFLLFWPWAMAAREGRRRPSIAAYYWHRVLRIMPAYWLMVIVALLVFYRDVFSQGWRLLRLLLLQQVVVLQDMPQSRTEPFHGGALSATWSLGTEAQFYLVLPLAGIILYQLLRARKEAIAIGILGVLIVACVVWRIEVSGPFYNFDNYGRFFIQAWMAYFAIGMMLAIVAVQIRFATTVPPALAAVRRFPWLFWAAAAAAYIIVSTPSLHSALEEEICVLVICTGLAAPLVLAEGKGPERLLRHPVMAWLGRISYGVFLWHIFIQLAVLKIIGQDWGTQSWGGFFVLGVVTAALSVLVAWLSYTLIELPLHRRFRLRSGQRYVGRDVEEPITEIGRSSEPATV